MRRLAHLALASLLVLGCRSAVASDLDEAQADEVLLALDLDGIVAAKVAERGRTGEARYRVEVPSGEVTAALSVLRASALPRRPPPGLDEVYGEGSLLPNASAERARLAAATAGELSVSLMAIDGVLDARVHLGLAPPGGALDDETRPGATASVLIAHRPERAPAVAQVRELVAGAVPGLAPEAVRVVLTESSPPTRAAPRTVTVGPFVVSPGSASWLRVVLACSFALNIALAAALALGRARRRRLSIEPAER